MAALLQTHYHLSLPSPRYPYLFPNQNPKYNPYSSSLLIILGTPRNSTLRFSGDRSLKHRSPSSPAAATRRECSETTPLKLPQALVRLTVSAALFLCCGIRACSASSPPLTAAVQQEQTIQDDHDGRKHEDNEKVADKELEAAFNTWKSKTYALTVPLKVVALRGSIPPSWIKDFISSQGSRMKFNVKYYASLESIFSDLSIPFTKGNLGPTSALAADIVGIGDSWLKFAIKKAIIEPIRDVEDQEWFKSLHEKWKVYLRRNSEGEMDPKGDIWAAPYRWGCMVIAYKTNKFQKHKLAPIEDWADLWRPDLAGRIAMVDSPREVVGAVLKYMGASYNANDINLEVNGGRDAVKHNLALLAKQVRLFDIINYLKAFGVGYVWEAVEENSERHHFLLVFQLTVFQGPTSTTDRHSPHTYVAIFHRKMIDWGRVRAPLVLIKWKVLPPKHGTWNYSSLRTRMFEGAGIVTGNKYAINFTFNCHLFLVMPFVSGEGSRIFFIL